MKRFVVLALLITSCAGWTQSATGPKPVALIAGLSTLHHPVSTSNPAAQQFFDQGLRLVYAFNHEEATRSFRHAAELDPHLAMAWWGLALAVGPNYNLPVDPEREKIAVDAVDRSLGGVLLQTGDAKAAEQTFREDLNQNPRNPRSLFGLEQALRRQNRDYDASWVKQQFDSAWQGADVQLKVEDL